MEGDKYAAYTRDVDAEAVAVLFEQKRGYRPLEVLDGGAVWLAGPLNGKGKSLVRRVEAEARPMTPAQARQLAMELA